MKALRSDNGGEYISNEFKNFCSKEGIRRGLIAPHIPQQNGVAERNNKTIVGVVRAMLHDQNRCPHGILGMITPEEAFTGKKLDVSHFNIFGSFVYVHVTKNARKKLELTAEVGIFVWYTEIPHNYRVYFPKSRMTVVRRDIKSTRRKP